MKDHGQTQILLFLLRNQIMNDDQGEVTMIHPNRIGIPMMILCPNRIPDLTQTLKILPLTPIPILILILTLLPRRNPVPG